jgi:tight adherence protein C
MLGGAGSHFSLHIGAVALGPVDMSLLALALGVLLWSAIALWRIGITEERRMRIASLRGVALRRDHMIEGRALPTVKPRRSLYDWLGALVAASPIVGTNEAKKLADKLAAAGIRGHSRVATFVGIKACSAVAVTAIGSLLIERQGWDTTGRLTGLVIGLIIGWRLPDLMVSRLTSRRRAKIELALPDALDLLVICAEAGLSLEQAIDEISRDLRVSSPELAQELATTASEMRVLPDRAVALENLGRRTGVANFYAMIATLNQSIRFGTRLSDSLRVFAAEMRNLRLSRFEENAARLPVLLTLPLMAFIVPCLFMIIGTPLALRIVDTFATVFSNGSSLP